MILSSIWATIGNLMLSLLPECALISPKFHEQVLKHKILLRSIGHVISSISIVITKLVKNLVPVNSHNRVLISLSGTKMWWSYKYKCPYVKVKWPVMTCSTSPGHRHTSTLQRVKALWVTIISHESENKSSKQNVFSRNYTNLKNIIIFFCCSWARKELIKWI